MMDQAINSARALRHCRLSLAASIRSSPMPTAAPSRFTASSHHSCSGSSSLAPKLSRVPIQQSLRESVFFHADNVSEPANLISVFLTCWNHPSPRMRRRQRLSKAPSLLSSVKVVAQVPALYSNVEITTAL
jgi:hypothetical protein